MPAGYAPLPTRQPSPEAERELDEAFGSDEDEDRLDDLVTTTPRTPRVSPHRSPLFEIPKPDSTVTPAYDFERDFDYVRPPPGSPPRPSTVALPNDFGNSNGLLPSSPVAAPTQTHRHSLFHRAVGAILPTRYTPLPTTGGPTHAHPRIVGGGTQNDGVFANVTAKPSRPVQARTDDGSVYVMPEEAQSNAPPSYAAAQADAVPPYWETTVHAPSGPDTDAGMIIDDLPSGSVFVFIANFFTSFFFQFVGFLVTYLLHTTHAAKYGSRAGLGLTLIQYGFYSRGGDGLVGTGIMQMSGDGTAEGMDDTSERSYLPATSSSASAGSTPVDSAFYNISSREWLSFLLMTLGWFILLSSLISFWRVKHWEASIRNTQARGSPSTEQIERDIATRWTLETPLNDTDGRHVPSQQELQVAQLQRDLHSAGLL